MDASAAGGGWQRLSPAVRVVWLGQALVIAVVVILLAAWIDYAVLAARGAWPLPAGALFGTAGVLALALAWWVPQAAYRRWRFALRPDAIVLERGLLRRVHTSVPRSRLRRVDVVSGPLARRAGLATVRLVTDERDPRDPRIPGLVTARADALRDALLRPEPRAASAPRRARRPRLAETPGMEREIQQWLPFAAAREPATAAAPPREASGPA